MVYRNRLQFRTDTMTECVCRQYYKIQNKGRSPFYFTLFLDQCSVRGTCSVGVRGMVSSTLQGTEQKVEDQGTTHPPLPIVKYHSSVQ